MTFLVRFGFLMLGLPNLISFVIVAAIGTLLLCIHPRLNKKLLLASVDFLSGFAAVFAGVFLGYCLELKPTAWLPMVAAVWFAIHFARFGRFGEFMRASIGTVAGWWAYTTFLS
jgi:hypothetical protein